MSPGWGDNPQDLKMGARCAKKEVVSLSGLHLVGLAWYWRFICKHRLLMLQVQGAMGGGEGETNPSLPIGGQKWPALSIPSHSI